MHVRPPSYGESLDETRARATDVAKGILADRGRRFRAARTNDEAQRIIDNDVERYIAEADLEAASAALLEATDFVDPGFTTGFVQMLCKWGEDSFYDDYNCEMALRTFQLAVGLDPANEKAVNGVLSVCLHGEPVLPEVALPYMVIMSKLNPGRGEIAYVVRLINEEAGGYKRA